MNKQMTVASFLNFGIENAFMAYMQQQMAQLSQGFDSLQRQLRNASHTLRLKPIFKHRLGSLQNASFQAFRFALFLGVSEACPLVVFVSHYSLIPVKLITVKISNSNCLNHDSQDYSINRILKQTKSHVRALPATPKQGEIQ
jgi:hypothetical protein